jgi:LacI family transcriptional regulator
MPRPNKSVKSALRRATLKEVARAAGVSLASASYAVNGTGSLGDATRNHILAVAQRLGYRQNQTARAMRTGKTGAIGLVLPDLTNPFFPTLAQSVIQTARQRAYSVFVTDTEGSPELETESIRLLVEHGVDGIVWFPIGDKNPAGTLCRPSWSIARFPVSNRSRPTTPPAGCSPPSIWSRRAIPRSA